jgi:hypothetical protein
MENKPILPGVQLFEGDFRINGQPAKIGQIVNPGDIVTTGPESSGVIVISTHALMIRSNSEIEIYQDFFETGDGQVSGTLKVLSGAMLSVFGHTETTIETPFATIGIRGTGCYVMANDEQTYACVCYGTGDLSSGGKLLETVTTIYHDAPRFIYPPGSEKLIEKAPVFDHSDLELRLLESMVNRRPPFDSDVGGGERSGY